MNIKKILIAVVTVIMTIILCTGCNYQLIDTTYKFDKAIVSLPNGNIIEGKVTSWKDYEGDQIQITIDGKTYLVHSSNVVLIKE